MISPRHPLFSSKFLLNSSPSSCNVNPLPSFAIQSSVHINQEHTRQILTSCNAHEDELKLIRTFISTPSNLPR